METPCFSSLNLIIEWAGYGVSRKASLPSYFHLADSKWRGIQRELKRNTWTLHPNPNSGPELEGASNLEADADFPPAPAPNSRFGPPKPVTYHIEQSSE
ncbi:uncharacterized protein N7529_003974 [Penicillium soppii]|uniref:uncharacterized protein n=1 Tax=Penicillium soppii TaxID=69789 RepID=UPI002549B8FC|nr:uncharacterized protein N7529_003974 [Penicillium soppii]KAJ5871621.1 hypothetical protein N7529_003974 [Penicillium soppii]